VRKRIFPVFVVLFLSILILLPLLITFLLSVVPVWGQAIPNEFGLIWWKEILKPKYAKAIFNTFVVAGLSSICIIVYGVAGSYLFSYYDFIGKDLLFSMILSPTCVSCTVVSLGLIVAYVPLRNTLWMMILGNFVVVSPFVMKYVHSSMSEISKDLIEASYSLGSSKMNTFIKIILPLSRQGILAGIILSIGMCISALSIMLMLYSADWITIPIHIYLENTTGTLGIAGAFSTILIIVTLLTVYLVDYVSEKYAGF